MNAQHTPGPWTIHEFSTPEVRTVTADGRTWNHADYYIGVGEKVIASALFQTSTGDDYGYPHVDDEAEFEANARLITAAPDLLAQLRFAVKLLGGIPTLNATAQVDAMRAAIAQATGDPA